MNPMLLSAITDHLWQSTLFALLAFGFALLLRDYPAKVRYWIWLAASVKFLVPFSIARPSFPTALLILWGAGGLTFFTICAVRWRRVAQTARRAVPVTVGREFDTLRRIEATAGVTRPIELRLSGSLLEPGVFGIFRPILILPAGIGCHLSKAQLGCVIAHEISHIRRFDNLTAAIHMLVEIVFWFHPVVWWLASRLVDERERACDEEVLKVVGQPQEYAEGLLKTCKLYVQSPVLAVSGVTGSDLKKRVSAILAVRA